MAISFDAFGSGFSFGGITSQSASITVGSGSNRALVVGVLGDTGAVDLLTGVTYNGSAMTRVVALAPQAGSTDIWSYLYYLSNPTSGANTIVATFSSAPFISAIDAVSYTGVLSSGNPEANASANSGGGSTSSISANLTTLSANDWVVAFGCCHSGSIAPGAGLTSRGTGGPGTFSILADTAAPIASPGAGTYGVSGASSNGFSLIVAALKPFLPAVVTPGTALITASTPTTVSLSCTGTSGGTGPYTQQWYRSATANFTPGGGNILAGATATTLTDTPGSVGPWFYEMIATDSLAATGASNQVGLLLPAHAAIGVICIGDSITAGSYLPAGAALPPSDMQGALTAIWGGRTVALANAGISGTATADWLPGVGGRLAGAVSAGAALSPPATIASIMLGANDANILGGSFAGGGPVSAATYGSNIAAICANLISNGYTVILHYPTYQAPGAFGGTWNQLSTGLTQAYQAQIQSLVNGTTIRLGDTTMYGWSMDNNANTAYFIDGVHSAAAGASVIGSAWGQAIGAALGYAPSRWTHY